MAELLVQLGADRVVVPAQIREAASFPDQQIGIVGLRSERLPGLRKLPGPLIAMLFATVVFAVGNFAPKGVSARMRLSGPAVLAVQFVISVYGGYFGAGVGILMLAALGLMGLSNIHRMNGLKNWGGSVMNFVAVVIFAISGIVNWPVAGAMAVGATVGGERRTWTQGQEVAIRATLIGDRLSVKDAPVVFIGYGGRDHVLEVGCADAWAADSSTAKKSSR